MAAITLMRRGTNKSHGREVPETDTALLAGLELSAAGAATLYTDANTTSITVGSAGTPLIVADAVRGPNDGTGLVLGHVPSGASTGSAMQAVTVTTTQRDQLVVAAGMVIYNTTTGTLEGRNGSAWNDLMAGAGGGVSLAATLLIGQVTGGRDIQVTTGDSIVGLAELTLVSTTTGAVSLDSGTTGAVNVGTGANAKAVTIGNTTGASSVDIDAGTGGVNIAGPTSTAAMTILLGTGGAGAKTITLGSTTSTSSMLLQAGTGTFDLTQAGGDAITVGQVGGSGTGSTLGLINMTRSERDANLTAVAGMLIWNTTSATVQSHNGTSWADIALRTAVFGQFTDTTSQKPGDTNPLVITFDTDDENEGVTHDRPEDFKTGAGVFTFLVQPQVERTSGGASMAFHCWARMGRRDGVITAVSVANPSVITATDHRIQNGQTVTLSNLSTTPDINGAHVITFIDADSFSIPVNVTAVADGVGDWTRQLDVNDDIERTTVELVLKSAGESDVIPLGITTRMVPNDVVQFYQSVSDSGVGGGLVAKTPSGEPAIPSVILSIAKGPG